MRNKISYYLYTLRYNKWKRFISFVNVILFFVSFIEALNTLRNSFTNIAITGVLIITSGKLLWDTYIFLRDIVSDKRLDNLTICEKENKYIKLKLDEGFELITHKYQMKNIVRASKLVYSKRINEYLIARSDSDIIWEECKSKQQTVKDFIVNNYNSLQYFLKLQYRKSNLFNKDYFNETKLCLSEDIEIGQSIKIHKGSYFDTVLTNFAAGKYIEDDSGAIVADFTSVNIIKQGQNGMYLKSITETAFNNHIGISTIAITKDRYLVLWIQNSRAQSSNGLIVPTGSGSCDFNDLSQEGFIKTIKIAMGRELLEESTKIKSNDPTLIETKVIGYYRWLEKGGKPEFVGITKLKLDYSDLKHNLKEVRKGNAHEDFSLSKRVSSTQELTDYLTYEIKNNKHLSVPLYFNMSSLLQYILSFEEEADLFLFGNNANDV